MNVIAANKLNQSIKKNTQYLIDENEYCPNIYCAWSVFFVCSDIVFCFVFFFFIVDLCGKR